MTIIEYNFEHDLIEDAFSQEYDNGLISIIFNCKEQGLNFHSYDVNFFHFSSEDAEYKTDDTNLRINDSDHILKLQAGCYLQYSFQCKNQIEFLYVPIYMKCTEKMWIKQCELKNKEYENQLDVLNKHLNLCEDNDVITWEILIKKHKLSHLFYNVKKFKK